MKKSLFLLALLLGLMFFGAENTFAQKVKYDNDTVSVDGKPYAIMKKKNVGPMRNDYVVSALTGTELIYFKSVLRDWYGTGFKYGSGQEMFYEVNFIATGNKADLKHYTGSGFAKLIVENNLVKDNAVDAESEKRFILLNNGSLASVRNATPAEPQPAVVVNINNNAGGAPAGGTAPAATPAPPKSKSPVVIKGNQIFRDDKLIGKFKQDTTTSTYSQKSTVITVYSEEGEKVAEASAPVINPQEWSIKIISDNKTYTILFDVPTERESLFKWLSNKNYLPN